MIQRSAGNPTRRTARRRYEDIERTELIPPRDQPHETLEEGRDRRRRHAFFMWLQLFTFCLGVIFMSTRTTWWVVAGTLLSAAWMFVDWDKLKR